MWDKVFKNETSEICGRQPLKILLAGNAYWQSLLKCF